jgi:DNA-binding CsgD family transcriptional regulator
VYGPGFAGWASFLVRHTVKPVSSPLLRTLAAPRVAPAHAPRTSAVLNLPTGQQSPSARRKPTDVPSQFYQSIIAIELAVAGALLFQIPFFVPRGETEREGEHLQPVELLDRLEPALPLLRSHVRDANPRQRTMEATLNWSYQLLHPSEQLLFERLSVFAGGFDLDAAQALIAGEDVLDDLTSLVDSSLVLAEPGPEKMRFRLLEPVRQFAEVRLVARGDREATQRQHADHYLRLAIRSEAELRSSEAGAVLAQLEKEEDNFRAAMRWARHLPNDLGLRLCTALAPWWAIRGRANEGRTWMDEMLRRLAGTDDLPLRALRDADHVRAGALTARELEIVDLIAEGLTNREIAQRLIISTRTVESHVDHIKTKLGFARRARIVAWALDRALADRPEPANPNSDR